MYREGVLIILAFSMLSADYLASETTVPLYRPVPDPPSYAEVLIDGDSLILETGKPDSYGLNPGEMLSIDSSGKKMITSMPGGHMMLFDIPIDINIASASDFEALPGIGEKTARKIVALREKLGRFSSPEQMQQIPGIGSRVMEGIRPYIVAGLKPADH